MRRAVSQAYFARNSGMWYGLKRALSIHRQLDAGPLRGRARIVISGVRVPRDADTGVVGEHALEADPHLRRSVGDDDLARVQRVADADAAAVMERDPRRAARAVEHRVEDRPVRDRIGAVLHLLRLAERRRDAAGVEMVAPDDDRRRDVALGDEVVERDAELRALALAEPADTR